MKKDDKIIQRGPFKGKRIEFAPTAGIEMFREVAEEVILTLVFVTPLAQTGGLNFRQGAVGLSATFLLGLAGWLIDGQEVQ